MCLHLHQIYLIVFKKKKITMTCVKILNIRKMDNCLTRIIHLQSRHNCSTRRFPVILKDNHFKFALDSFGQPVFSGLFKDNHQNYMIIITFKFNRYKKIFLDIEFYILYLHTILYIFKNLSSNYVILKIFILNIARKYGMKIYNK
jgi:hypothetical protein